MKLKKSMATLSIAALLTSVYPLHTAHAVDASQLLGTLLGAAGGAAAGSNVGKGKGRTVAIAVGTLLGAGVGGSVGRSVGHHNAHAYPAYGTPYAPTVYHQTEYVMPQYQNIAYQPAPIYNYNYNNIGSGAAEPYCREFTQAVHIGGRIQESYGTACRMPDGTWEIQP